MKTEYIYSIRYQEVDAQRKLRLHTLENYLLEVAGLVADEQGYGIQYLYPQGLTWIIARLSLEIQYLPTHGEQIAIETWVEQAQHMLSTRCYRIWLIGADKTHRQLIGKAKSQWAVLDLKKREIVNVFDQAVFDGSVDGEILDIAKPHRVNLSQLSEPQRPYTIRYSDVDYNLHCNSCKYLEHMLNTIYQPWYSEGVRIDIAYQREVRLGDSILIHYLEQEGRTSYCIKNKNQEICCTCQITKLENSKC